MVEDINSLADAEIFLTYDAKCSYWPVEVDKPHNEKTVFTFQHGLYQFTGIPFGLKKASATLQNVMDVVLPTVNWQHNFVYLDDISVFPVIPEDYRKYTRSVLHLLNNAAVNLKLKIGRFSSAGYTIYATKSILASKRLKIIVLMLFETWKYQL